MVWFDGKKEKTVSEHTNHQHNTNTTTRDTDSSISWDRKGNCNRGQKHRGHVHEAAPLARRCGRSTHSSPAVWQPASLSFGSRLCRSLAKRGRGDLLGASDRIDTMGMHNR
uniref:Uncharacterized protein n=1 Tax=Vitrella brassicaformis TaxID=1169539 RepID=A0A7S1JTU2_9ALVE